jgi:hypothetical protein
MQGMENDLTKLYSDTSELCFFVVREYCNIEGSTRAHHLVFETPLVKSGPVILYYF